MWYAKLIFLWVCAFTKIENHAFFVLFFLKYFPFFFRSPQKLKWNVIVYIFLIALIEDLPDEDLLNETKNDKLDDSMKVLDGYSDHGSNFSHSRSRSLSGSFSVELSNLSGSSLGIFFSHKI